MGNDGNDEMIPVYNDANSWLIKIPFSVVCCARCLKKATVMDNHDNRKMKLINHLPSDLPSIAAGLSSKMCGWLRLISRFWRWLVLSTVSGSQS